MVAAWGGSGGTAGVSKQDGCRCGCCSPGHLPCNLVCTTQPSFRPIAGCLQKQLVMQSKLSTALSATTHMQTRGRT